MREVVKLLFKQLSLTKEESHYRTNSINKIPEDTIKLMRQFWQRGDISRVVPGKRDVVTVCFGNGKK